MSIDQLLNLTSLTSFKSFICGVLQSVSSSSVGYLIPPVPDTIITPFPPDTPTDSHPLLIQVTLLHIMTVYNRAHCH